MGENVVGADEHVAGVPLFGGSGHGSIASASEGMTKALRAGVGRVSSFASASFMCLTFNCGCCDDANVRLTQLRPIMRRPRRYILITRKGFCL